MKTDQFGRKRKAKRAGSAFASCGATAFKEGAAHAAGEVVVKLALAAIALLIGVNLST